MDVALVTSFAVFFFPYLVNVINTPVKKQTNRHNSAIPDKEEVTGFVTIAVASTYCSCMWNPIVCVIFNANLRTGFKTILQTLSVQRCFVAINNC